VAWIPHALTLCGLACGFFSLVATAAHDFVPAAAFILTAVFFDGFDGAAARALRCEGPRGEALDSLADLAAFGLAPALLAYEASLHRFGPAGALVGVVFAACGALRLARFPLVKHRRDFVGLPIPMAGTLVAVLGASPVEVAPAGLPAVMLVVSLLMVSSIEFPKFATVLRLLPAPLRWGLCLIVAPVLFVEARWGLVVLLLLYLALGAARALRLALAHDRA
jgi:CDP-diacylglycerol--serine O-phosphatidyltransferase